MKKITKLLLGVVIAFVMTLNAHAVTISTNSTAGTIDTGSRYVTNTSTLTVSGVQSADTFKAYKILNTFYNSTTNTFTYEFTSTFQTFLTSTNGQTNDYSSLTLAQYQALTSGNTTSGSTTTNSTLDTLVSLYTTYIKANNVSGNDMTVSSTNATASLEAGAWLVLPTSTTKVYAVMVGNVEFKANSNGTDWDITSPSITAKASSAAISKVLKNTSTIEGSYSIRDEYNYLITASIPTYPTNATNKTLTITETLENGITFGSIADVIVKDGATTLTTNTNGTVVDTNEHTVATIVKNGQEVTITLNADYISTNTVTIEYPATLNNSAVLGSTGNKTTTTLTYATQPYSTGNGTTTTTEGVVNTVTTYGIRLFKKNSSNTGLQGAEYIVYSDSGLTTSVGTITTGNDGYGTIDGLASGTYYLKENKAPTGYRINNDILTVTINTSNNYTETNQEDTQMGLLPTTGGIGTYIFIVMGAIIVIGALVFLYKYLNKNKNKDGK